MSAKPAIDRVGRVDAVAGQRHIGAGKARRARQQKRRADVGEKADADFRHRHRGAIGDDAVRSMCRKANAAAHHQAIHHRDKRLRITRDQHVEMIFGRPEFLWQRVARLRRVVERADIAARAQAALAGAVEQHRADRRIGGPGRAAARHRTAMSSVSAFSAFGRFSVMRRSAPFATIGRRDLVDSSSANLA